MFEKGAAPPPPLSEISGAHKKYDPAATGDVIKRRRKQLGMTQPALASLVGLSVPSISKYETGKITGMTYSLMKSFANALDIPVSDLTDASADNSFTKRNEAHTTHDSAAQSEPTALSESKSYLNQASTPASLIRTASYYEVRSNSPHSSALKAIPLIGKTAAGAPIFAIDEMDEYIYIQQSENVDFAVRIQGDSMINARIYDGDILFAKRQSSVQNGEIAIVAIDDAPDESYVTTKRFYKYGKTILLRSENPLHKDIEITKNSGKAVRIIGKAVFIKAYVY